MPKEQIFTVAANEPIALDTYLLRLQGDTEGLSYPGQFVEVEIPGFYLRRPFSIYRVLPGELQLIYKVLGEGTASLVGLSPGTTLKVLTGLGNGFTVVSTPHPVIVGGGVGVVPLQFLAENLVAEGIYPEVVLGFNTAAEVFLDQELRALGLNVTVTTVDGTTGKAGFVTDALPANADYFYACGPTPMMEALLRTTTIPGQLSLEERMACGFGACMGCATPTASGRDRVCKEGPIFTRDELNVDWDTETRSREES